MSGRCRRRPAAGRQAGRSLRDNDQKEYLTYAQHGYAGLRKSCGEASSQRVGALSGWRWVVRSIRRVQLEGSLRPRAGAHLSLSDLELSGALGLVAQSARLHEVVGMGQDGTPGYN